jgi:hypothetical protein
MATDPTRWQAPAPVRLEGDERIEVLAKAVEANIVVTDKRVLVATDERLIVDVPFDRLRRIQFDIERRRPATLVLVPEWPRDPPQTLSIQPDEYGGVAEVLSVIGVRIHALE